MPINLWIKHVTERINLSLVLILVLATFLRVFLLSSIPNGFTQDEAINGYDAYSILKTGRDGFGVFLPMFVRSLNDYRESPHIFLLVPFIQLFGLTELATRLPSALIGVLTVWVVYYLAKELFNQRIGLFASLFLAISPWHIQFSRIGFGAILVPFCFCLGLLFLFKSFKQPFYLYLSALGFGLTLYTYAAARVFTSLFLVGVLILFGRHFWRFKKQTAIASVIFLTIFLILLQFWISPEGMARAKFVGLVKDPILLLQNYLSYFSPDFLFLNGDANLRHSPRGIGELYWIEMITVPVGLFFLFKHGGKPRNALLLWFFLYPIPAILTEPGHALRAIVGSPLFAILSGYGFVQIIERLKFTSKQIIWSIVFLATLNISIFWKFYFIDYPKDASYKVWRYGMKETINYIEKNSNCVVISNLFHHTHTFILFYTQYDPSLYQKSPLDSSITFQGQGGYSLGKYRIMPISKDLKLDQTCLLVLMPGENKILEQAGYRLSKVKLIKNPHNKPEIQIFRID